MFGVRTFIALFAALFMGACESSQDIARNNWNSDDATCRSYGAEPGSQAYMQCRMAKDQQRQSNNNSQ